MAAFVDAGSDALVITTTNGVTPGRSSFGSSIWRPACRRVDLAGVRMHDLRHAYVSLLLAAGADVQEVSKWAGHASVIVTPSTYAHILADRGDDISDEMDRLLTGSRAPVANVRAIGF